MLGSGLANINLWYPWQFSFPVTHYWVAWITIGALVVHIGAKRATTRAGAARRPRRPSAADDAEPTPTRPRVARDRRAFLAGVFATSGLLTLFTVGQTVRPLSLARAARRPAAPTSGRRASR